MTGAVLALMLLGFLPVGTLMLRPLEDRFPQASLKDLQPDGIVVLGGAIDQVIGAARGQVTISESATRITARRRAGSPIPEGEDSSIRVAPPPSCRKSAERPRMRGGFGCRSGSTPPGSRSRTGPATPTRMPASSATCCGRLRGKRGSSSPRPITCPDPWVCSGPRAFRWCPYPVDYRTTGTWRDAFPNLQLSFGLARLDFATREWIGLLAYRLSGKIADVFPAP